MSSNLLQVAEGIAAGQLWVLVGDNGVPVNVTSDGALESRDLTVIAELQDTTYGLEAIYNVLSSGGVSVDLDAIIEDIGNPSIRTNLTSIEAIIGWQDIVSVQPLADVLGAGASGRYKTSGSIGADFGTLLDSRITSARAGYLDQLDFALNERLGSPSGVSLAVDIAENQTDLNLLLTNLSIVDTVVDGIQTDLDNNTDGLGKIATELSGAGTSGNFSYLLAGAEQTVLEFAKTNIYSILSLFLDLTNFTVGRILTVKAYAKVDGTNYQQIDEMDYTVGTHDVVHISPMLNLDHNIKLSITINTVEVGNVSVPYRYVLSDYT